MSDQDVLSLTQGYLVTFPSLPQANAQNRGRIAILYGAAGVVDQIKVCRKKTDDTYEWYDVTQIPDVGVTTAKLADGAVTIPKLSFDPATQAELDAKFDGLLGHKHDATAGNGPQLVTGSLSVPGYAKLPNGLILQWMMNNTSGGTSFAWPTAFPNACLAPMICFRDSTSGGPIGITSYTKTGFTVLQASAVYFIAWAVGY